ncbi:hypothetical protein CDIK_1205 [Cucumispora dikerogammari]|nr:hypothetical protein CDIK_1205 [Cucumispora dikerogammari]
MEVFKQSLHSIFKEKKIENIKMVADTDFIGISYSGHCYFSEENKHESNRQWVICNKRNFMVGCYDPDYMSKGIKTFPCSDSLFDFFSKDTKIIAQTIKEFVSSHIETSLMRMTFAGVSQWGYLYTTSGYIGTQKCNKYQVSMHTVDTTLDNSKTLRSNKIQNSPMVNQNPK